MTPKEKAEDLVQKFIDIENMGRFSDNNGFSSWSTTVLMKQAKECIMITVHELIKEQSKGAEYKSARYQDERILFWLEVKQEIEKL